MGQTCFIIVYLLFNLLLSDTPFHEFVTFCLFIYNLVDFKNIFYLWLSWIMLLWTFVYNFLCGQIFSCLLGMYLWVELLDLTISPYILFHLCSWWGNVRLFQRKWTILYSYSVIYRYLFIYFSHLHMKVPFSLWFC